MHPTRRFWTTAALAGFVAAFAVVVARPAALPGAVAVGAWLVASAADGVRSVSVADGSLRASVTADRTLVAVEDETTLALEVELAEPSSAAVEVRAPLPPGARGPDADARTVRLAPGETAATTAFAVEFPVAGRIALPTPTVRYADGRGLFTETVERGAAPAVTVEPRRPRNLHVGRGGDRLTAAYGEHPAGRTGAGITPAELRQYVVGDAAARIDWKATARLTSPHVREFEAETDRRTVVVFDHRAAMDLGPGGETMLDYVREVALGYADAAAEFGDPLGLVAVGDEGLTARREPTTTPAGYRDVRERLLDLSPTLTPSDTARSVSDAPGPAPTSPVGAGATGPSEAREAADRLADDGSAFGRRLRPFFEATDVYVERAESDPLFRAVERLGAGRGRRWTVLVTDDGDRERLRETVELARRRDNYALVFLTPRVLFEPGGLADLERAYERYLEFEEFRRELDRLARVTAFEVGPGDRIEAVLASRRERATR